MTLDKLSFLFPRQSTGQDLHPRSSTFATVLYLRVGLLAAFEVADEFELTCLLQEVPRAPSSLLFENRFWVLAAEFHDPPKRLL